MHYMEPEKKKLGDQGVQSYQNWDKLESYHLE